MFRLIILLFLIALAWRYWKGRWPWQPKPLPARDQAILNARRILGVDAHADKRDINAAHRRLLSLVHPDRGGSSEQVHELDAARALLLAERSVTND